MSKRREERLPRLLERCLPEGDSLDAAPLGTFVRGSGAIVFEPSPRPLIFLAYAQEDRSTVRKLYGALRKAGFDPWMDCENLLPGQNWPRAIERTIELSDYFLGCFSRRSLVRRGHFHSELNYALTMAARVPQDQIFFIPVRLDQCSVPRHIERTTHYVDTFPDWQRGIRKLIKAIRQQSGGSTWRSSIR